MDAQNKADERTHEEADDQERPVHGLGGRQSRRCQLDGIPNRCSLHALTRSTPAADRIVASRASHPTAMTCRPRHMLASSRSTVALVSIAHSAGPEAASRRSIIQAGMWTPGTLRFIGRATSPDRGTM